MQIFQQTRTTPPIPGQSYTAEERIQSLEQKVDHLSLICRALWSIFAEEGHTEEQLVARVNEIDLLDGKLDNKFTPGPTTCKACGRTVNARHRTCMFCGEKLEIDNAFDRL